MHQTKKGNEWYFGMKVHAGVDAATGYLGAPKRPEIINDETLSQVEFRINKHPSSLKMADDFKGMNWDKKMEHEKSAVRCKVEHPFLIVKRQMGYAKGVYKGIEKICIDSICCLQVPI